MHLGIIHKAIQMFEDYLQNLNHKIKFLAILHKLGTIDPGLTMEKNHWLYFVNISYEVKSLSIWIIHKCRIYEKKTNVHLLPQL